MKILQEAVDTYQLSMKKREYPPCFDSLGDYLFWSEAEDLNHTKPTRKFACRDCTSRFQKERVRESRCAIPKIPVVEIIRD